MSVVDPIEEIEEQAIEDALREDKYGEALREGRIIFSPYIPISSHPLRKEDIPDSKYYTQIQTKYKVCQ